MLFDKIGEKSVFLFDEYFRCSVFTLIATRVCSVHSSTLVNSSLVMKPSLFLSNSLNAVSVLADLSALFITSTLNKQRRIKYNSLLRCTKACLASYGMCLINQYSRRNIGLILCSPLCKRETLLLRTWDYSLDTCHSHYSNILALTLM